MSRRLLALLVVLTVVGLPAGVLRAICAGNSCPAPVKPARVPFCTLPADVRAEIEAGFRDGRSPEVLGVTREAVSQSALPAEDPAPFWPSLDRRPDARVPLVLAGTGFVAGATIPDGTRLDAVAPTIADAIGLRRPNPGVRSGVAVEGVASGEVPQLVLLVAWKGVGSVDLEAAARDWPFLRSLAKGGAGTLAAQPGSSPLDPAATLTTIGSGGLPSQHGITGTLLRNDQGELVRAWGDGSPFSVIASLGDDLDESRDQDALIGLVGTDPADRGLVGGNWYLGHDRDLVVIDRDPASEAVRLLRADYPVSFGGDDVPDLLALAMGESVAQMDSDLARVVSAARRASAGSVGIVVTATGPAGPRDARAAKRGGELLARAIERRVPGPAATIQAVVPGGLFLDQQVLADRGIGSGVIVRELASVAGMDGEPFVAESFPGFAVSFARFC